ncbi:MAG TPA: hypothetical protein VHE30_26020 [Polyangiaceae bacterium]|nr:hypothetical protein [Polyangiaceae bacterium]
MSASTWARVSLELAKMHQEQRAELDAAHHRLRERLQALAVQDDESEDDEPTDD